MLIPENIAVRHQMILNGFTKRGANNKNFIDYRPIFGQNKKGFIFPVMLKLKIEVIGQDDFGVSGIFKKVTNKLEYLLVSDKFRIAGISENMYKKFFRENFDVLETRSFNINKIFPLFLGTMEMKAQDLEETGRNSNDDIYESYMFVSKYKDARLRL